MLDISKIQTSKPITNYAECLAITQKQLDPSENLYKSRTRNRNQGNYVLNP